REEYNNKSSRRTKSKPTERYYRDKRVQTEILNLSLSLVIKWENISKLVTFLVFSSLSVTRLSFSVP
ncbi:unnamed protein product, partial [Arabidopsis halleri]